MGEKEITKAIKIAKKQYFTEAQAVLVKRGLTDMSVDDLRKFLNTGAKKSKSPPKKVAS